MLAAVLLGTDAQAQTTATFNSASDIPITSPGYTASGTLTLALNFAPPPGTSLTVVNNTALTPISGTFTGLAQGGTISASFGGRNYSFIANYWGGTGNDLVLVWPDTGLAAWGDNAFLQLADGTSTNRSLPVTVTSGALAGKTVLGVAGGYRHSLAFTSEGKVYAWGDNTYGQLGDGTNTQRPAPVQVVHSGVLAGKTVVAISAGLYHSMALTSEGRVYVWGDSSYDQLGEGTGTPAQSTTPVAVDISGSLAGKTVAAISAGGDHNLVLASDGVIYGWGRSDFGQVGTGFTGISYFSPVPVTSTDPLLTGKTASVVAAGLYHSLALTTDGYIAAWGRNADGQLGDGTLADRSSAVAVVHTGALAGKTVRNLAAGGYHSHALDSNGVVYSWGYSGEGQLGYEGAHDPKVPIAIPSAEIGVPASALTGKTVASVKAGLFHSLALTTEGKLATWGKGSEGQRGGGSTSGFIPSRPENVNQLGILKDRAVLFLPAMPTASHCLTGASDAPEISVEDSTSEPSLPVADNVAVNAGTVLIGQNAVRSFTIRNLGTLPLSDLAVTVSGAHSAEFVVTAQPAGTLAPGATTSFAVTFTPAATGARTAQLSIANNDWDESPFEIQMSGTGSTSTVISANFASASSVPVTASGFSASGLTLDITLQFAPATGTNLTVINNTALTPISGVFGNVAEGAAVTLAFGGVPYSFVATYFGGTGNDLVLLWPYRGLADWGYNGQGGLGNGSTTDSPAPVNVDMTGVLAGKTVSAFSRGGGYSLVLTTEGRVYSWGANFDGQLGVGGTIFTAPSSSAVPVAVLSTGALAGKRVVAISAGSYHALALTADGLVFAWGQGGALGDGSNVSQSYAPVQVTHTGAMAGKFIVAISAGNGISLALASDGTVYSWGFNTGDGTATQRLSPVQVNHTGVLAGRTVTAVAAGYRAGFVLTSDGRIAAWGANTFGNYLGEGSGADQLLPVLLGQTGVLSGKTVAGISTSLQTRFARTADGNWHAWGINNYGQLGDGTLADKSMPVLVTDYGAMAGQGIDLVQCTNSTTHVLTTNSQLFGWGANGSGDVGDGTTTNRPSPVAVSTAGVLNGKPLLALAAGGGGVIYANPAPPPPPIPDIGVEDVTSGTTELSDGGSVAFGNVDVGDNLTRSFALRNIGTASLTGIAITIDGAHAADFTVTTPPAGSVAAGGSTSFAVRFSPSAGGVRSAALHIASNDPDESSFDLSLSGTGVVPPPSPEIVVEDTTSGTLNLSDGGSVAYGTLVLAQQSTRAFTVRNTGTADLTGLAITLDGAHSGDFTVISPPAATVIPGGSTTFSVRCQPEATGARTAALHLANNDANESPFDLALGCSCIAGDPVNVTWNSASDVPVTAAGYTASGKVLVPTLNFVPAFSTSLTVVNNTSQAPISGAFVGLPQGTGMTLVFGGNSYTFIADYFAGTGNDLVLVPKNSSIAASGRNDTGQLGDGTTTNRSTSIIPSGLDGIPLIAVSAGLYHSLALAADGTVYAWGKNTSGQLGDGTNTDRLTPVPVDHTGVLAGKTVIAIGTGEEHSVALASDGRVYAWGKNGFGQIGDGTYTNRNLPVEVDATGALAGKTVTRISVGGNHVLVLTSDNGIYAWGRNAYGQIGDNSAANKASPVAVWTLGIPAGKTYVRVAAGGDHSLVLTSDGKVYAWGLNSNGQIGDNTTTVRYYPIAVYVGLGSSLTIKTVSEIAAGAAHSIARASDGTMHAWGLNTSGQLGDATVTQRKLPVAMYATTLAGRTVTHFCAGAGSTHVCLSDGSIYSTGMNSYGQLATGDLANRAILNAAATGSGGLFNRPAIELGTGPSAYHLLVLTAFDPPGGFGVPLAPEIVVEEPAGTSISDGGARNFGTVNPGDNTSLAFTIKNTGNSDLTGLGITIDGANAGDFTLFATPMAPVAPSGSTTFVIRFTPAAAGNRAAVLHIANNDTDENPFDVSLSGTGNSPPADGIMTLNPASPVNASAALNVSFSGWTDADGPLTYQVLVDNVPLAPAGASASINFTGPATAGSHPLKGIITDALGAATEVTQNFTVNTAQESWRLLYFGTTSNSGSAADSADPDGDTRSNLEEFAAGTDPTVSSSGTISVSGGVITLRGAPTVSVANIPGGVDFRALFGRRKDYVAAGLTYTVQFSADLSIWQDSAATPTVIADDGTIEACTVPYPFFINGKKARFFRVVITGSP